MSRTVKDSAILLQALAGHDPRDSASLREPAPDFVGAVDKEISGLRIAWSPDYGYAGVDAEVVEVSASAARAFEGMGCTVEESDLALDDPFGTWWVFFASNVYRDAGASAG